MRGLKPLMEKYVKHGLIEPCISECNTPIMAVPKPKQKAEDPTVYKFIHNLKAVNSIVKPLLVVVANPYTILNGVPVNATHFSVIDLKDAFFSIPVNQERRNLFAFEWMDPDTKRI